MQITPLLNDNNKMKNIIKIAWEIEPSKKFRLLNHAQHCKFVHIWVYWFVRFIGSFHITTINETDHYYHCDNRMTKKKKNSVEKREKDNKNAHQCLWCKWRQPINLWVAWHEFGQRSVWRNVFNLLIVLFFFHFSQMWFR